MITFMILPLFLMLGVFGLFIWQAVWVAIDSRKKGEEYWWLWTIAAIIAFPVGLIVYVLVTRSDRSRCNNCGKEVPHNVNSCPYCGVKCGLFCPSCGQKVEATWRYCPNCTTELPDEIKNAKIIKKSDKKTIIIIIAIIVAVFLLIIGLFASFTAYTFESVAQVEEITADNARDMGYLGAEYDTEYTDIRSYNLQQGVSSINYIGKRKSGKVIIRIYDSEGKLLLESKPIKDKKINDVLNVENGYGTKIEIEYINFKGSFFFDF